jgi:radical SAM superfamily enzyme YgiQ (UPF0313 family)
MSFHVLLVNPWIHDLAAYDFWLKPLGLLTLAESLRKAGMSVSLLDCMDIHHPLPGSAQLKSRLKRRPDGRGKFFAQEIQKPEPLKAIPRRFKRYGMPGEFFKAALSQMARPDLVLLSAVMTYWYTGTAETISEIRKTFPDVPVAVGGLYPTLLPEHARRNTGADIIIQGDWEKELPPHLKSILEIEIDLYSPMKVKPAFDLYAQIDYYCVLSSRGCPFRCSFCASPLLHPHIQRKDPALVIEEIEDAVKERGIKDVAFYDDALILDESSHLSVILEGVISRNLKARFHAPNALHLRGMTKDLALLLKRSGFKTLRFGLESTNPERQRSTGGKVTNEEFREAVAILNEAGFASDEIGVYLLVGLPGQSPREIEADIRFALKEGARPYLAEYSPIPKTALWQEAVETARYDIAGEPLFHNNSLLPCAHPELTTEKLSYLKKCALKADLEKSPKS